MAEIKPMALIESMKKKVCEHSDVYFRTNKQTGKVTNSERQARGRFGTVARTVNERMHDLSRITADQQAFLAQKDLANGKKTMKAYLWKLELQAYDEQHS